MKWAGLEMPKCITVHQRVNSQHMKVHNYHHKFSTSCTYSHQQHSKVMTHGTMIKSYSQLEQTYVLAIIKPLYS